MVKTQGKNLHGFRIHSNLRLTVKIVKEISLSRLTNAIQACKVNYVKQDRFFQINLLNIEVAL